MKYIKVLKRRAMSEIFIWLVFMGVTYFLWDFNGFYETAAYYDSTSTIRVLDDPTYNTILYALNEQDANYLSDYKLTLVNDTYREEKYNVYLAISKNIIQSHIKIKNETVKYLSEIYSYEDDDYCYYLLDTNMLQGSEKKYNFSLFNDLNGENFVPYELKIELEKI